MVLHYIYWILAILIGCTETALTAGSWLRCWLFVPYFIGTLLCLWLLHALFTALCSLFADTENRPENMHNLFRWISVTTLDAFMAEAGLRFTVTGCEKLPEENFLLVCNHLSIIDPLAMMVLFRKRNVAFIAKKEIRAIPVVSRLMVPCGCLFLDRSDSRAAVTVIRKAAEFITGGVGSMAICPEGTRNRTSAPVLPFHAGSFKIATKAACPLVIAALNGTQNLHKNYPWRRTPVQVEILDVVSAEKVAQSKSTELAKYAEDSVRQWITAQRS